jgi:hypothetical protein
LIKVGCGIGLASAFRVLIGGLAVNMKPKVYENREEQNTDGEKIHCGEGSFKNIAISNPYLYI